VALVDHLPRPSADAATADEVYSGFADHLALQGIELYPAQEEAILAVLLGNHVIVNTPTGSGKSLVATAAHFAALAAGRRSFYTAPVKALVSEKFFALCDEFGSERVGMITGDVAVNPDAPIVCATAEILAHLALRCGAVAPLDVAIVDEFHFYGDPQRGWAWQVPLLELPHVQFVLMSATLGDVRFFARDLEARTGRDAVVVTSAHRPVPLHFEYRTTTLHHSVEALLEAGTVPVYVVHFSQKDATDAAQGYLALDPLSRPEKEAVRQALQGFGFDTPIGKDLRRYISAGIGVHHAGLLPKYRLLVEKLAQDGLLKIICGTDTLGVGINVPIRAVLFTQLCKFDGTGVRILTNRDFAQIAGRAGRKGFDDRGDVWVQAPPHVVENLRSEQRAAATGRKSVKKRPPERGYAHWTQATFDRLVGGQPEPLRSNFQVNHQMVMSVLDRPTIDGVDGCAAVRRLLVDNHETPTRRRAHIRRAIAIYRSLVDADLLEFPDAPDELGRRVRVNFDLQDEFALHQPLSLWAVDAIDALASTGPVDPLDVVTIVEAVQETPAVIVNAQLELVKSELMAEMKSAGVEYEERIERLANAEPPRPNKEWIYASFNEFRAGHPWVGGDTVRPKSIARELWERVMTFTEYVNHYGLKRSEGVLLRYLTDVYRGLTQNVPERARTDDLDDVIAWLGAIVRQVDSSLIDEWERLRHAADGPIGSRATSGGTR
jgi:superfamily II RNA helicase